MFFSNKKGKMITNNLRIHETKYKEFLKLHCASLLLYLRCLELDFALARKCFIIVYKNRKFTVFQKIENILQESLLSEQTT
jgi:hypothetical protein